MHKAVDSGRKVKGDFGEIQRNWKRIESKMTWLIVSSVKGKYYDRAFSTIA
jgi:hypothetical protein